MSKKAPPLGKLTQKEQTKLPTPTVKPMASSESLHEGMGAITEVPIGMMPGFKDTGEILNVDMVAKTDNTYKPGAPTPTVGNTVPPSTGNAIPPMDFSKVGGEAGAAIANYKAPEDKMPMFFQSESRPDVPLNPNLVGNLAGDASQPFNFTGFGAGEVGTEQVQVQPGEMTPVSTAAGGFNSDPTAVPGMARIAINNNQPVEQYSYTQGPTASQVNARNFLSELQDFRAQVAPHQIPALQYVPQNLSSSVAGGFASENKGPHSWFIQGPNQDINPLEGKFGASGGGLLGGVGWVFGRLSPFTYAQGAAMDVARAGASIWEGGSAFIDNLLKTGDIGKAYDVGTTAASTNYLSNSPVARGMYTNKVMGSTDAGDFWTSSYFLSAASGAGDYSFSNVGNGVLGGGGEAARNVRMKDENFNPFGLRNPFRTGFKTGALEAKERAQGAWFGHGYDEWARGGVGLGLDILSPDRLLKNSVRAAFKGVPTAKAPVPVGAPLGSGTARYIPSPTVTPRLALPPAKTFPVSATKPLQKGEAAFNALSNRGNRGGALAVVPKKELGISEVIEGEIVETATDIVVRHQRTPVYYNRQRALPSSGEMVMYNPASERYLPKGADPFSVSSTRAYTPAPGDIDFSKGGALVPVAKGEITPAVLGVGGKPGGIPNKPRASESRRFVGNPAEPVTYWDDVTQSFKTSGKELPSVERVLSSPGTIPQKITPRPLPEPSRPLRGDVPKPQLKGTVDDLAGNILEGTVTTQKLLPPIVPKSTPNFTISPAKPTVPDTLEDVLTGVFKDSKELAAITNRFNAPRVADDIPPILVLPPSRFQSVTAEALAPSVAHADIVRQLTNPGALVVINPRLATRVERDVSSLAEIARTVELPNGVRVLGETDVVDKFSVLNRNIDNAILASGLNPSSMEANSIRRIFDRIGKEVPEGLQRGFSVEVAARKLDEPAQYVTPLLAPAKETVTPLLAPAKETVDVVSKTVVDAVTPAKKVKPAKLTKKQKAQLRSDSWGNAINGPKTPSQAVSLWSSSKKQEYITPAKFKDGDTTLSGADLRQLSVPQRIEVLRGALKDGLAVPKQAIDDALNPDVLTDVVAAKDYAKANLAKDARPLDLNTKARELIHEHREIVGDIDVVNKHITDVSTQLYDIERSLDGFLKKVDELPDVGVDNLVDDVPLPLNGLPMNELPPKLADELVPDNFSLTSYYHGTRVEGLHLTYLDPIEGASRSELGTGIWLTRSQDIASAAAGRTVPANVVPMSSRTFSENAYIHELDDKVLRNLNILPANEPLPANALDALTNVFKDPYVLGSYIDYGEDLGKSLLKYITTSKGVTGEDLFSKVDDLTHDAAKRYMGGRADELELTYVQRTITDALRASGVEGFTNGINTVVYRTDSLRAKVVHDVTSAVGNSADDVTTSLHNVNLLSRSLEASPKSKLLQVQLEEAKAVAASKIRDSLTEELAVMNKQKNKLVSDLIDADDKLVKLTDDQIAAKRYARELADEEALKKFEDEFAKDWENMCL